jgi:hypothetical protein
MYLLHRELIDRGPVSEALGRWRDTLIEQARWTGIGCVWSGLQDFPEDGPADDLVDVVRGAHVRQTAHLTAHELAQARIAMADYPGAEKFWGGVEEDAYTRDAVSMVLAAFLELVGGQIDARYGQLVHDAESEGSTSLMPNAADVVSSRLLNRLSSSPSLSSSRNKRLRVPFPVTVRGHSAKFREKFC